MTRLPHKNAVSWRIINSRIPTIVWRRCSNTIIIIKIWLRHRTRLCTKPHSPWNHKIICRGRIVRILNSKQWKIWYSQWITISVCIKPIIWIRRGTHWPIWKVITMIWVVIGSSAYRINCWVTIRTHNTFTQRFRPVT